MEISMWMFLVMAIVISIVVGSNVVPLIRPLNSVL